MLRPAHFAVGLLAMLAARGVWCHAAPPSAGGPATVQPAARTTARTTARGLAPSTPLEDEEPAAVPAMVARGIGVVSVVAEGSGSTEEDALKDAFRAAVRQTVGSIVSSKTDVKDDVELVNRVVTFSNGFIVDHQVLKTWQEGGYVHRRISAVVRKQDLAMRVKEEQGSSRCSGRGLWPEVITKLERQKSAVELYKVTMENFPWDCVTVGLLGRPKVLQVRDDAAYFAPSVALRVDSEKFHAREAALTQALGVLAKASGSLEMQPSKPNPTNYAALESRFRTRFFNDDFPSPLKHRTVTFSGVNSFFSPRAPDVIKKALEPLADKGGMLFVVGSSRKWKWFFVQESVDLPRARKAVAINFSDAGGRKVSKQTIGLGPALPAISINDTSLAGSRFVTVFVSPYFLDHAGSGPNVNMLAGCVSITVDGEASIGFGDVARVDDVSADVE